MLKTFVMNEGDSSSDDEEIKELLRKKEKWICYTRLSLLTYKKNFIHAAIYLILCIALLFFIHEHHIRLLAGDGVSGFYPEYRYHYVSLLASYWETWWMHMFKVLPLWLAWSCIKKPIFDYASFRLILTDKRVIIVAGIVSKDYVDLPLEKIETIRVIQDINGKIFKYGDLIFHGVGDTKISVGGVSEPLLFKKQIDHYQHVIAE